MSDLNPYEEGLAIDLAKANDRIEALIAERDEAWRRAGHAEKMWGETEVKLAKAVEVAEKSIKWLRLYGAGVHREAVALKKLTGGKDD